MKKAFLAAGTWPAIGVFWVLLKAAGLGLVPSAALALLQTAVFLLVAENENRTTKLDYAVMFFFLTGLCLAVIREPLGRIFLETNFNFFLFLSLFLAAVLPVIFRAEPFTMAFAKRTTPEAFWTTDLFTKINLIMTLVWAGLFITGALIALIPILWVQLAVPPALVIVIGVPFTIKYPDRHLKAQGMGPLSSFSGDALPPLDTVSAPEPGPAPVLSPADIDQERLKTVEKLGPVNKILVIQGSPRGKRGHTDTCLDRFLEGVREEGLEPEIFYLHKMNIKPCVGCFNCWVETPGVCVHKNDDMPDLLDKIRQADVVVHAFPLYIFTVPGIAKNFLDRSIPLIKPFLVKGANGLTGHPHRGDKPMRLVLMSVCGFPEVEHFQALVQMYRSFSQAGEMPIVAELLRTASESLPSGPNLGSPYHISMDA
ncbi:MAG: flavodoxin family protein, partial [Thermodesulfobacteriota bacterium]|nr:flavodoxin family protein [Thermodesulfobacteriota bacterium]